MKETFLLDNEICPKAKKIFDLNGTIYNLYRRIKKIYGL